MKTSKSEKALIAQTEGLLVKLSERAIAKLEQAGFYDPYISCYMQRYDDDVLLSWSIHETGKGDEEHKLISKGHEIGTLSEALESINDICKERQLKARMFKLQNELAECERSLDELPQAKT